MGGLKFDFLEIVKGFITFVIVSNDSIMKPPYDYGKFVHILGHRRQQNRIMGNPNDVITIAPKTIQWSFITARKKSKSSRMAYPPLFTVHSLKSYLLIGFKRNVNRFIFNDFDSESHYF